jgi:hypothetical protein
MMTTKQDEGHWFADLLMKFAPTEVEVTGETPEEMTSSASWKTFGISTAAALPPGPFGLATILPELMAVTKIQMNLIYAIAAYHKKEGKLNSTLVLLIFANEAGVEVGKAVAKQMGAKLIIKTLGSRSIRAIAQKIGIKITARITQKAVGRWIPFVLAPIFGAFSKAMTTRIGEEANRLFSQDFDVEETKLCPNGHDVVEGSKFCQECGATM